MPKWTKQEEANIAIVRHHCEALLKLSPNYPEVVGDRKIVRFLRGHNQDVDKVCMMMNKFLKWRVDNNVDEIRKNIVEGGFDHPSKFPKADIILSLIPQLVIIPHIMDNFGCPICVEQYNFNPSEVLKHISIAEYIIFQIYSLEFKSLVLDQLSHQREQEYLNSLSPEERNKIDTPDSTLPPYGVLANICVIRDLNAVGFAHLGQQGQEIIKALVSIASDNYPELMRKCFMINTPFVFNAVWYIVKGWLAPRTIAKVSVRGSSFFDELLTEIKKDNLPAMVGGSYHGYIDYEPHPFDLTYLLPATQPPSPDKIIDTDTAEIVAVNECTTASYRSSSEDNIPTTSSIDTDINTCTDEINPTYIANHHTSTSIATAAMVRSTTNVNDQNKEIEVNVISMRTTGY